MTRTNTPTHINLWHKGFWCLIISNMMMSAAVYMFLVVFALVIPTRWLQSGGLLPGCYLAYAAGLFALGPFCSYVVQRFRRNLVCIWSMLAFSAAVSYLYYILTHIPERDLGCVPYLLLFVVGAFYGLSRMVLSSTLIVDVTESFQRNNANHASEWMSRLGIALGPLLVCVFREHAEVETLLAVPAVLGVAAAFLIVVVNFPFRAPEEGVHVISTDRFFLRQGVVLFLSLCLSSLLIGIFLSTTLVATGYFALLVGFYLVLLYQRISSVTHFFESKYIYIGNMLLLVSVLAGLLLPAYCISDLLLGVGLGFSGSAYLLGFISKSRHCQRGTSQSTYILGRETGIACGMALGFMLHRDALPFDMELALLSVAALVCSTMLVFWGMRISLK